MRNKKITLFCLFLFFCFFNNLAYASVLLTSDGDVEFQYIEVGNLYVIVNDVNISVNGTTEDLEFNISYLNEIGDNRSVGERLIDFNVTYGGSTVVFTFVGNTSNDNMLYNLDVAGSRVVNEQGPNTFTYTHSSWSTVAFSLMCGGYQPDPPYNGSSTFNNTIPVPTVNLTWERGNYSNQEVLVGKTTGYPTSPSDGTIWQNSTSLFYNFTINQTQYFTVWSYNSTTNTFSATGLDIPWGVLRLNVFNQSRTWQTVDPFGLTIQNQAGDTVFQQSTCSPPFFLDINDIPIGVDTVFVINASNYQQQRFEEDTIVNYFHNFTFLLPPVITSTPGGGDDDLVTGDPTNHTESLLYLISVIDELSSPVIDVRVEFNLYVNATDTYEAAGSFTTDGNGQGTVYLVPNNLYQVVVSKDDYQTGTSYWTPSRELLSKTFMIEFEETTPKSPDEEYRDVTITLERRDTTLYVNYTDALNGTDDTQLIIYEITISGETSFDTYDTTDTDSWSYSVTVNSSRDYKITLWYNHSVFGSKIKTLYVDGERSTLTDPGKINTLLTAIVGTHPMGWGNFLLVLFCVAVFYYADQEDAHKMLILLGGIFLFLNLFVGFNTTFLTVAGGVIPTLVIVIGIIAIWNDSRKGGG